MLSHSTENPDRKRAGVTGGPHREMWHIIDVCMPSSFIISTPLENSQMDRGGAGGEMAATATAAESSTNQKTESFKGCSSSTKTFYPLYIPFKKRKSQYELSDPRMSSLKHKFQDRITWQEDESARTESIGCDGIFIGKNCDTNMVNVAGELDSCENTRSLFGGCIEVDSINGIEIQSMRKTFKVRASTSRSSSNNVSSEAFSSSHSCSAKESDSWVMQHLEHDHQSLMLQPYDDDIEFDVFGQYNYLMKNELVGDDIDDSATDTMDETLYSNGVEDFMILPTSKSGCHDKKQLTIDQEFEQYFSKLML